MEIRNPLFSQTASKKMIWIMILLFCILLAAGGTVWLKTGSAKPENQAEFTVQKGPLTISVLESGTIKAKEQVIIKNEVEGRTSIIYLIDEGQRVKTGDLLVELDASSLLDNKIDQEIRVQNAEAAFINAQENLAVVKNQAESDKDKARLTFEFAKQDLDNYIQGTYPNEMKAAESEITLAREELQRAQETLKWSRTLSKEKYISQTELQADELAEQRMALRLELAINNLDLLKNFTYKRQIAQLESDVSQAQMALERTNRKANADVVQAEAELKAKEAEFKQQKDKLVKLEDQLKKTKLYAPAEGLVIYATSAQSGGFRGNTEPLDEGQEVHEREELIYLPIGLSSIAEVDIHESSLKKVRPGLPAVVTVDALQGKRFLGTVDSIAPLPDAQSMWMNPDLKVYNTRIGLETQDAALRTGMGCKAEIIVEQYHDAMYVPVQSVLRIDGQPTVFVSVGSGVETRTVQVGLDNNRMIHILGGLKEGEKVLLAPPLKAAQVDPSRQSLSDSDSSLNEKIQNRLNEADMQTALPDSSNQNPQGQTPQRRGRPDQQNLTPEQQEQMRKQLESMTPEQREQMRRRRQPEQSGQNQSPNSNEARQ